MRRSMFAAAALAGSLGASLLMLEWGLRLFFPLDLSMQVEVRRQTIPGIQREIVYERNAFGLRSLSMRSERKPPGTVRILVLGGSTTDLPYQASRDTWWGRLDQQLRAEFAPLGVDIEVAAFGRGGKTAIHRLAWARTNLERFDPDIVVTLEGINDLTWHGDAQYRYDDLEGALASADRQTSRPCGDWLEICRRVEQFEELLARALRGNSVELEWHSENLPDLTRAYRALPRTASVERPNDPFQEFSAVMEALIELTSAQRRRLVVLGQPVLWKPAPTAQEETRLWFSVATPAGPVRPDPEWLTAEIARYNQRQAQLAAERGALYVAATIPRDLEHFFDDCHFTDRGSARMADLLHEPLRQTVMEVLRDRDRAREASLPQPPGYGEIEESLHRPVRNRPMVVRRSV